MTTSIHGSLFPKFYKQVALGQACDIFTRIFKYLNDKDTTSKIRVSRYWKHIITKTAILEQSIMAQYCTSKRYPYSSKTDVFFIGERHSSKSDKKLAGRFISSLTYKYEKLFVFIEGPLRQTRDFLSTFDVPRRFTDKISICSWDDPIAFKQIHVVLQMPPFSQKSCKVTQEATIAAISHLHLERTKKMVKVIEGIPDLLKKGHAKIIFIAGAAHFKCPPKLKPYKEYDLNAFHVALKNLNATILFSYGTRTHLKKCK